MADPPACATTARPSRRTSGAVNCTETAVAKSAAVTSSWCLGHHSPGAAEEDSFDRNRRRRLRRAVSTVIPVSMRRAPSSVTAAIPRALPRPQAGCSACACLGAPSKHLRAEAIAHWVDDCQFAVAALSGGGHSAARLRLGLPIIAVTVSPVVHSTSLPCLIRSPSSLRCRNCDRPADSAAATRASPS